MHREFVYVLKAGPFYKIGRTNNITRRISELQIQLPFEAELFKVINTDDAISLERDLHYMFAHCRTNGEWFKLSFLDAYHLFTWNPSYKVFDDDFDKYLGRENKWNDLVRDMTEAFNKFMNKYASNLRQQNSIEWVVAEKDTDQKDT